MHFPSDSVTEAASFDDKDFEEMDCESILTSNYCAPCIITYNHHHHHQGQWENQNNYLDHHKTQLFLQYLLVLINNIIII